MTDRLFVYGTLMRSSHHALARALAEHGTHVGPARFNGRLYRITHYPGVIPSSSAAEWVFGDLYTLKDIDLLKDLDRYEGCGPDDPPPTQYLRQRHTVTLLSGPSIEAWIYIYNRPVERLKWIVSGRFNEMDDF